MNEFIQALFTGLTIGFVYTLVGFGYTMVYQVKKVINFSQGEIVMLGGITGVILYEKIENIILTIFIIIIICFVFSFFLKKLFQISKNQDSLSLIVLTIGYAFFIRGLVEVFIGKNIFSFPDFFTQQESWNIYFFDAVFTFSGLLIVFSSFVILILLFSFLKHHREGQAILATCDNEKAAVLMGINLEKIYLFIFTLSAIIGALGGVLLTLLSSIHYESGILLGLKGFVVAIIGGIASPFGPVLGGVLLGLFESLMAAYISTEYKDAFAFIILIIILIIKPQGLLGKKEIHL